MMRGPRIVTRSRLTLRTVLRVIQSLLMLSLLVSPMLQGIARAAEFAEVKAGVPLVFPRDHGSHPAFRTEWWYITGWLRAADGREFGVQVTFFRSRTGVQEDNPSGFAPTQLVFAHAAITDVAAGRLRHDQRSARAGHGLAYAAEGDTDVRIDHWQLRRSAQGYHTRIRGREIDFDLAFAPTQPLLLQGDAGFSRKGPLPQQASYYYSQPHLAVSGRVLLDGRSTPVTGRAWLDHEWSSEYLAKDAAGWDWAGIHLNDGGSLMAFRIRDPEGRTLWAGGTYRDAGGRVLVLEPSQVAFTPIRHWRSPRTGTRYPVSVRIDAGPLHFELRPLLDDQELDTGATTGTVYWEGAVRAFSAEREAGRGYLELTGYAQRLRM